MSEYHIRIQDIQPKDRPRERLLKSGPSALSDPELLAIILRTGTHGENVLNLSNRILSTYNIQQLSRTTPTKLQEIRGVGAAKAAEMAAMFELARRLETFTEEERPRISSPEAAYAAWKRSKEVGRARARRREEALKRLGRTDFD